MARTAIVTLCAVLLGAGVARASEADQPAFAPFPIRNFQPFELLYYQPGMAGAEAVPAGAVSVELMFGETNTLIAAVRGSQEAVADLEMSRLLLAVRYGVARGLELGIDLPLLSVHGGVMDGFIRNVEDFVAEPRTLRANEDPNSFAFLLREGERLIVDGTRGKAGVGDLALTGKWHLWERRGLRPSAAVRAALELPTGDVEDGFGSGTVDGAIGVIVQQRWRDLSAIANGSVTFPGGQLSHSGPRVMTAAGTAGLALLLHVARHLALVGQFAFYQGIFDEEVRPLRGNVKEWTAGLQWCPHRDLALGLGFVEDAFQSEEQAADVTFFATLRWTGHPVARASQLR